MPVYSLNFRKNCKKWNKIFGEFFCFSGEGNRGNALMKRIIAVLSVSCAVLFGLLLWQIVKTPAPDTSSAISSQQQSDEPLYLVRAQKNGMIAVYPYGSNTAVTVTDIRLSSLREYDQALIQRGFPLYSEEDLASFLEDFDS